MMKQSSIYFFPEKIGWIGIAILTGTLLLSIPFIWSSQIDFVRIKQPKLEKERMSPLQISLGLNTEGPFLPIPNLANEMTFSFDPARPGETHNENRLLVRLKKSAESQRVALPCRLDLEVQRDKIVFSKQPSSFWIELSQKMDGQIEGKEYIASIDEGKAEAGIFPIVPQDCPIQIAQEFSEGSAFRTLAEAHWWGRDLFREQYEGKGFTERLEIGSNFLELKEGDWLVWKEGRWQKSEPINGLPIAHIHSNSGRALILEGWNGDGYVRLSLGLSASSPFKIKGEELFASIRIRSEKQISCMLEKQCMILKIGDWVLKSNGRWKVLRKEQEREAFLNGKAWGELFVFEQIHQKQGQKTIQGRIFNPGRTQMIPIEMAAQSRKTGSRKGKTS